MNTKDYAAAMNEIVRKVAARIVGPIMVSYSAYGDEDKIDNLDEVAIEGKAILLDEGYMTPRYESKVVENPTWLDLCVLANFMILKVGDHHHVYFENVRLDEKKTAERTDGVKMYRFCMGS